mmetsp:Transcript_5844/g.13369  ORF Transcript_5844/g.13369 Transcript_5844/m.13369 type:complete len:105 (+) Transcript_5844:144-458(+)
MIGADVNTAPAVGLGFAVNVSYAVVVGARLEDGDGDAVDPIAATASSSLDDLLGSIAPATLAETATTRKRARTARMQLRLFLPLHQGAIDAVMNNGSLFSLSSL